MKYTGTLSIEGLGVRLPVVVELEPVEAPSPTDHLIDETQLRARWKCSARTLKRLRDQHRLPYVQISPRRVAYRRDEVTKYEAACGRGVARRVGRP